MKKIYSFLLNNKKRLIILFFSIFYFIIDIVSKLIVIDSGNLLFKKEIIHDFFYIDLQKNTGAAFSILQNQRILFIVIGIIALTFFFYSIVKEDLNILKIISYSLLIGGIIGNLFDRIIYGYVIDFLSFKFGNYYFPVFNFADTFIVLGAIILGIDVLSGGFYEVRSKRK